MVADSLDILGNQKVVKDCLALVRLADFFNQIPFDCAVKAVNYIVTDNHIPCLAVIPFDVGSHRFVQHLDNLVGHFGKLIHLSVFAVRHFLDKVGDVDRMVADSLHVRNHLECGRNMTQIRGYRLLLEQKLQAEAFNFPLHLVYRLVVLCNLARRIHIPPHQSNHGTLNGNFNHLSHADN